MRRVLTENKGLIFAFGDQFVVSAGNFVIGVIAARMLGVADFGTLTVVLIFTNFALAFLSSILVAPMMTLSGLRTLRTSNYYTAIMVWSFVLSSTGGIVVGLVVVGMYYASGTPNLAFLVISAICCTVFQNMLYVSRRLLFARHSGFRALVVDVLRYVLFAVMLLVWSRIETASVSMILMCLGLSALVAMLPLTRFLFDGRVRTNLVACVWHRHWPISKHLIIAVFLTFGHEQIVMLAAGRMLGDEAVGGLRAGQYLIGVTHFLLMALENFIPTGAAEEYSRGGTSALSRYLFRCTMLFGGIVGILILAIALPAGTWLALVFGDEYAEFGLVLRIYAIGYCIAFIRDMCVYYLRTVERTDVISRAYTASFITSAVLFYPCITYAGLYGAAFVIVVAHFVSMIFVLVSAKVITRQIELGRARVTASEPTLPVVAAAGSNTRNWNFSLQSIIFRGK